MVAGVPAQQLSRGTITGTVKDSSGAIVGRARVSLINAQQAILTTTESDAEGRFRFDEVPVGSYVVLTSRPDFSPRRVVANVNHGSNTDINVLLEINQLSEEVTVTAETGVAEDKDRIAQQVNIITEDALRLRTTDVLAQVADEEVGVSLQRTSPTMGANFCARSDGQKRSRLC